MPTRDAPGSEGYGRADAASVTIASGGNASAEVNLKRGYAIHVIRCANMDGVAADSYLKVQVGEDAADTVCDLYENNAPQTLFLKGPLPATAVTWRFVLTHAFGAQRLKLLLVASDGTTAKNTSADVAFVIYGHDPTLVG